MKIKEQKKINLGFKIGQKIDLKNLVKVLNKIENVGYFDYEKTYDVYFVELIEREETKEEKTERETREKQIALERERNEKTMLETLKKKYEKDTDNK
jgi:hypothetical protein